MYAIISNEVSQGNLFIVVALSSLQSEKLNVIFINFAAVEKTSYYSSTVIEPKGGCEIEERNRISWQDEQCRLLYESHIIRR